MKPITRPAQTMKEWLAIIANTCPESQLNATIKITNPDTKETITMFGRDSEPKGLKTIF